MTKKCKIIVFCILSILFYSCSTSKKNESNVINLDLMFKNAKLYKSQGQYSKAEPIFKELLELYESGFGKEYLGTITMVQYLAEIYVEQGRYGDAEPLLKESLKLAEKNLGKWHQKTLTLTLDLANLYRLQGRYEEAEPLFKKVLKLSKIFGEKNPIIPKITGHMGLMYSSIKQYKKAEPLLKEAMNFCEINLGEKDPYTITSINNLALLHTLQKRYDQAEPLFIKALHLSREVHGNSHHNTITTINNLAQLYDYQDKFGKAESFYKESLKLFENTLGKTHPNTIVTIQNLILFYVRPEIKKTQNAYKLLKRLEDFYLARSCQELESTESERTRQFYMNNLSIFQDITFSFAINFPSQKHQKFAVNVLLRSKNVLEEESAIQQRFAQLTKDKEVIDIKNSIKKITKKLSTLISQKKFRQDSQILIDHLQNAKKLLRQKAMQINPSLQVSKANIKSVLKSLPENSVLIEYRVFKFMDFKSKSKNAYLHLAAYVILLKDSSEEIIKFIDLGKLEDIYVLWKGWQSFENPNSQYLMHLKAMWGSDIVHMNKTFITHRCAYVMYQKLISPFETMLNDIETLYIAPDSFLNLIPFSSLLTSMYDYNYLIKQFQVNRIQTGRDLLRNSSEKCKSKLIAFGGIAYDNKHNENNTTITDQQNAIILKNINTNQKANEQLSKFKYLPHSKTEASKIVNLYKFNRKNADFELNYGKNASESVLFNLKQAPEILHLSTHGFYLKPNKISTLPSEKQMFLSGLALAGANTGMNGIVDDDGNDGLLYSSEVTCLNLQGTKLVSLSACNTGIGILDYSEGFYSLARAFRIAGAESILMTLWTVGDKASEDFMTIFYEYYLCSVKKLTPGEALHKTRLYFLKHKNKAYRNPRVWAPYVIVGR